jgi:hypothetical protein
MYQNNIIIIKKRARVFQIIMKLILVCGIVVLLATFFIAIVLLFASEERFNAVKGNLNWFVEYKINETKSLGVYIPYEIIQPLNENLLNSKSALITYLFSKSIIYIPLILYSVKQITDILSSIVNDKTPFIMDNTRRFTKLAYTIIIYSIVPDIIFSLLCWIFVTKRFLINLSTIQLSSILLGGFLLLFAELIKYGAFLQEEFDTTL